ncbi:hypothetical protein F5144DRAFT_543072 [Chaetomium tenue]|uniref:Uncharacterized protein n=1 Tax=Chaetomium tenue TaxID=1854479 RepID=A0ACB7PNT6_9PEZI|nr:hypothetical protein F5144DRAFT_543072 [Chaetomium globosum]
MTPLIFTTFLISLALVDLRHSALRAHYHADPNTNTNTNRQPARRVLPPWLHRIVYRYQPHRYANSSPRPAAGPGSSPGSMGGSSDGGGGGAGEYYHSKQRELMRMEAEEAFEMRGVVVVGLGLAVIYWRWVVGGGEYGGGDVAWGVST